MSPNLEKDNKNTFKNTLQVGYCTTAQLHMVDKGWFQCFFFFPPGSHGRRDAHPTGRPHVLWDEEDY